MKSSKLIIVAAASVMCLSSQAWAGSKSLGCKPVENSDPIHKYQFELTNATKGEVPAGANVTIKISPKKVQGIDPKTVVTTFHAVLKSALDMKGTVQEPGTGFAKSCTASAKW